MLLLRWIKWLLLGALALFVLLLALSNRQPVSLKLFPSDLTIEMPLYALCFLMLIIGVLMGGIFALAEKIHEIRALHHRDRSIKALRNEVEALKAEKKIAGAYQKGDNTASTALTRK